MMTRRLFAFVATLLLAACCLPGRAGEIDWRKDYSNALQEARAKGLPLVLNFGTEACLWCDKLDVTTFRDPEVIRLVNACFIPVKIPAARYPDLIEQLKIQSYPTFLAADPSGKVLNAHAGFLNAPAFLEFLRRASPVSTVSAAPPGTATSEAVPQASLDGLSRERMEQAHAMMQQAREDFRTQQYLVCLIRCETIGTRFADLAEGAQATELVEKITNNPEWMQQVCNSLPDLGGISFLKMAEAKLKQGQPQQAVFFLERLLQVFPNTRYAELAHVRLSQIQGPPALPVSEEKKQ
jgi:thioredoxin-related protein